MKLRELLEVLERTMKDAAPANHIYAFSLWIFMKNKHKDLLDEEVEIK